MTAVHENVSLDASGGAEKKYIINKIQNRVTVHSKHFIAVRPSAAAVKLFKAVRTPHSAFKIPFTSGEEAMCYKSVSSDDAEELWDEFVIVWDEINVSS